MEKQQVKTLRVRHKTSKLERDMTQSSWLHVKRNWEVIGEYDENGNLGDLNPSSPQHSQPVQRSQEGAVAIGNVSQGEGQGPLLQASIEEPGEEEEEEEDLLGQKVEEEAEADLLTGESQEGVVADPGTDQAPAANQEPVKEPVKKEVKAAPKKSTTAKSPKK